MQANPSLQQASETDTQVRERRVVSDETLVVRNYDGNDAHEVDVTFLDADGDVAVSRTLTVAPLETIAIETRLKRGVYLVRARLDTGETDSAECLVGSGPTETALVETGNGAVSVAEGLV